MKYSHIKTNMHSTSTKMKKLTFDFEMKLSSEFLYVDE